ncbi:MAG: hybrid sensor histidine kinase/response regulator, partial [Gluconacetobacter diazotrophicus]|nr:hybrid sensor histidine kinase/response regulator [Gluconacetobacter diazotrophicus]
RALERQREPGGWLDAGTRILVIADPRWSGATAYEAGADDVLEGSAPVEAMVLRIRAVARRKLIQDEAGRLGIELREQRLDAERAREEAATNAAKAALAEALAHANLGLAEANEQLRDTQGKLVQAAKMASLGELVAGIAHEINNPLAFILGHHDTVRRLLERLEDGILGEEHAARLRKARDRVDGMGVGLKRIQELVVSLRRFSRLDESEQQDVDVPEAIETVLALLAHRIGAEMEVRLALRAPAVLRCQPALLNQVVMNIVGNAADALHGHEVSAGASGKVIEVASRMDGGIYEISISDNGPGIPDAVRERVFEPFFTTKPVGAGTGLGLSIAWSVVRANGGTIEVERSASGGARFVIRVPVGNGVTA